MNKVIVTGRLVRDPEMRYTQSGKAVTNFTIAVDRHNKEKEADFIKINTWDAQAENVAKFLAKGSLVLIEGSIRTGSYEKDGQKVFTTEVIAQRVDFLDTKRKDSDVEDVFLKVVDDDDVPF